MPLLNFGFIRALEKTGLDDFIILIPIYLTSDNLFVLFHDLVFYTEVFYCIIISVYKWVHTDSNICFLFLFFSNLKQQFFYPQKSAI